MELYQSYIQKQHCHLQNNAEQKNTTENSKKSLKKYSREEITRKTWRRYPAIERINKSPEKPKTMTTKHRKLKWNRPKESNENQKRSDKRLKNTLKHFTMFYQNIKRIKLKVDSLTKTVDDTNPTITCIIETNILKKEKTAIPV